MLIAPAGLGAPEVCYWGSKIAQRREIINEHP
jgi:hypothetical protein